LHPHHHERIGDRGEVNGVDAALPARLGRWFGTVHRIDEAVPELTAFLEELVEMLDAVAPARLDRARSSVMHPAADVVEIEIAHDVDEEQGIHIRIADRATVAWLLVHEHVDREDGYGDRPWTRVTVDLVAAVLRGDYETEDQFRGRWWLRSKIVDVAEGDERTVSEMGPIWGALPWPRASEVQRRRLDYGTGSR
jgi:hypothetical protein